ncbi:hypothetical protein [Citrobacter freundii]|uniref:hypothetical protein n=1 Tax=Citrobacter freundii TaxID=546 RepID=UPI0023B06C96|nr:hypothetical protein [Citrobacter freundii]
MTALNEQAYRVDGGDIGVGRLKEIADNAYGDEEKRWLAQRVLALLDDLDAAKKLATQQGNIAVALLDEVTTLRRNVDDKAPELRELLEAAENRMAELEARKFKVEMPESFYPDGDIEAPLVLQEHEVIAAIVAAGGMPIAICRRCKSELDLSHRPDGSHYCHAPAAGIGVKGE